MYIGIAHYLTENMSPSTLLIAYGNPDRQDDGVSWVLLQRIAASYGRVLTDTNADYYDELGQNPDFFFTLQLTPELSDLIQRYERVCFMDAHLGDDYPDVHTEILHPRYEPSTLSHHMTPQFLLDITLATHQHTPAALLISVRGFEFKFQQGLSDKTNHLSELAEAEIHHWLKAG